MRWKESHKKQYVCTYCKKIFFKFRSARSTKNNFCSMVCYSKWQSKYLNGKNSFNYKKEKDTKCSFCGKLIHSQRMLKHCFCNMLCYRKWYKQNNKQKNNPNWKGGVSKIRNPYNYLWNKDLRNRLTQKYENICQICGDQRDLCIHHINYNKRDMAENNLFLLCRKCNTMVNYDRKYWENYCNFHVS